MMEFYMVRHGQTQLNLESKFYGSLEPALTDYGRQQAAQIADQLDLEFDAVFCSSQRRARETLSILQKNNPSICDSKISYHPALAEKSFGIWEGLDADEIEALDPGTWWAFMEKPFEATAQGAESYEDFSNRVLAQFRQIQEAGEAKNLVVAHQGVFRVIVQEYFEKEKSFWDLSFRQDRYYKYSL